MIFMTKWAFRIVHLVCMSVVRPGSNSMSRWRRDYWPMVVAWRTRACLRWLDRRWAAMWLGRHPRWIRPRKKGEKRFLLKVQWTKKKKLRKRKSENRQRKKNSPNFVLNFRRVLLAADRDQDDGKWAGKIRTDLRERTTDFGFRFLC